MEDYCDSPKAKRHPLFSKLKNALQIILYFDEVELCNPLVPIISLTNLLEFVVSFLFLISPNWELVSLPFLSACHSSLSFWSLVAASILPMSSISSFILSRYWSCRNKQFFTNYGSSMLLSEQDMIPQC